MEKQFLVSWVPRGWNAWSSSYTCPIARLSHCDTKGSVCTLPVLFVLSEALRSGQNLEDDMNLGLGLVGMFPTLIELPLH
jgi:hypothetical protein